MELVRPAATVFTRTAERAAVTEDEFSRVSPMIPNDGLFILHPFLMRVTSWKEQVQLGLQYLARMMADSFAGSLLA